jgi:hypothetical protein
VFNFIEFHFKKTFTDKINMPIRGYSEICGKQVQSNGGKKVKTQAVIVAAFFALTAIKYKKMYYGNFYCPL